MNARLVSVSEGRRLAGSIEIGPHTLTADPHGPGGEDTDPTPVELLLAALGSCTSTAVRAAADRHGWLLDRVDVTAQFDPQGQIVRHIRLTGDLDAVQIQQLLAVAARCPVQRLLTREARVVTVPTVATRPGATRTRPQPQ